MREVAVIGVGQSSFGKFPERTAADLGAEAVRAAIEDCRISPEDHSGCLRCEKL